MYTMTLADANISMPTNGRGGAATNRTITDGTITATSATSVTVTNLGANVVAGDILIAGQGCWGVATLVAGNVVSVKRWHRLGGGVNVIPPASGTLIAHPGGVLRTAQSSKITGVLASGETITFTDALGTHIVVAANPFEFPIKMWGPWRATASAAGPTIAFECTGNLDI